MGQYTIEMKEISKSFPGTKALDKASLAIKPGEIHALLGENGAGKSTLMNILTGQFAMDEGQIIYQGNAIQIHSPKDAFAQNIVLVPQELNLIPEGSIAENIFLGNERYCRKGIDWKQTRQQAERLLALLDIEIDVTKKVKTISPAYQQLVSIARALSYLPKVLILDEPTAVLTNKETESLFAAMQRLKDSGTAIVFITHHLDEVLSEADRLTIMRDGKVVKVAEVAGMTKEDIITAMAGRKVDKTESIHREVTGDIFWEARGISRRGEFTEVSFTLRQGEILCVAGLVGAGRTEIFKAVFGITRKEDGGETFIEGKPVDIKSPSDAIAYGMGYVSEERRHDGIAPGMSVMENMMLPSYPQLEKRGLIDFSKACSTADEYIEKFKIKTPGQTAAIKNLSGGNQQKVIVARWLAKGVKMLILDEPTRGIDVNAKGEIHQLIRQMADNGVAVVVISSEMEEVLALADRVMVVHQGKVKGYIEDVSSATEESVLQIAFN